MKAKKRSEIQLHVVYNFSYAIFNIQFEMGGQKKDGGPKKGEKKGPKVSTSWNPHDAKGPKKADKWGTKNTKI